MEVMKTIVFVSQKLTKRKLKEIENLVTRFKKLVNFFLDICLKYDVHSKGRLHGLAYEDSKRIIADRGIHSKYR